MGLPPLSGVSEGPVSANQRVRPATLYQSFTVSFDTGEAGEALFRVSSGNRYCCYFSTYLTLAALPWRTVHQLSYSASLLLYQHDSRLTTQLLGTKGTYATVPKVG